MKKLAITNYQAEFNIFIALLHYSAIGNKLFFSVFSYIVFSITSFLLVYAIEKPSAIKLKKNLLNKNYYNKLKLYK